MFLETSTMGLEVLNAENLVYHRTNTKIVKLPFADNSNPTHSMEPAPKAGTTYNKYSIPANHSKYSPVVLRKSTLFAGPTEPKELIPSEARVEDCSITNSRSSEFRNVLRQPKQSEMTYFGVGVNAAREVAQKEPQKPSGIRVGKPRRPTPEQEKFIQSPIYENLKAPLKYSGGKDFDVSILDELTKAADQILQVGMSIQY